MCLVRNFFSRSGLFAITFLVTLGSVNAGDFGSRIGTSESESDAAVELFEAIDQETVVAEYIAVSASRGNLLIRNPGKSPVSLRVPELVGAMPVLAQFGAGQFGAGQFGAGQGMGAGQGIGAGRQMAGLGFGAQDGGGGGGSQQVGGAVGQGGGNRIGGMLRIAPRKTRKLSVTSVCLEHGKPDPTAKIPYRLVPLSELTDDGSISLALSAMGRKELSQKATQAIAWHRGNELSWAKLSGLNRLNSRYLGTVKFFTGKEINDAKAFLESLRSESSIAALLGGESH